MGLQQMQVVDGCARAAVSLRFEICIGLGWYYGYGKNVALVAKSLVRIKQL